MGKYATGKHAVLIDDRSGFKIKYKNARTEWTGFRVYKGDWEPKQPQLDPQNYISGSEANILYKPRPDQDSVPTTVFLGSLYGKWSGQCAANLGLAVAITPADAPSGFAATSALGTAVIALADEVSGFEATSALGSVTINAAEVVDGLELGTMTGSLGTTGLFINGTEIPPGLAGTSSLGTITLNLSHPVTGFVGTTTLGTAQAAIIVQVSVTMTAMTATLGTVAINYPSWGSSTWGSDTWGD
jgi:hypothetical protein